MELKSVTLKKSFTETYGKEGKTKTIGIFDVTTNEQYPKILAVTFFGKAAEAFQKHNAVAGDKFDLKIEVTSREYNGKYFTEAAAFGSYKLNGGQQPRQAQPTATQPASNSNFLPADMDLPF